MAENGTLRRKVSISGRILRSRNSIEQVAQLHVRPPASSTALTCTSTCNCKSLRCFLFLQQEAENRKKQLEELLDEHAQIVHQVEVAETPSDGDGDADVDNATDVTNLDLIDNKENAASKNQRRSSATSRVTHA